MSADEKDRKPPLTERQQWDNLVTELDAELLVYGPVRYQLGKILYAMKVHLQKHGLDKGRKGRWESILRERKIEKSTASSPWLKSGFLLK